MDETEKVRKILETIKQENIKFKRHFYKMCAERPIDEGMVRRYLKKTDSLLKAETQPTLKEGEKKYKIWLKISNKYNLVLIISIIQKNLYIITGWNSDKKWQKAVLK